METTKKNSIVVTQKVQKKSEFIPHQKKTQKNKNKTKTKELQQQQPTENNERVIVSPCQQLT